MARASLLNICAWEGISFCGHAQFDSNWITTHYSDCAGNQYSDYNDLAANGGWVCTCANGCVINDDGSFKECQMTFSNLPYNSCVCPPVSTSACSDCTGFDPSPNQALFLDAPNGCFTLAEANQMIADGTWCCGDHVDQKMLQNPDVCYVAPNEGGHECYADDSFASCGPTNCPAPYKVETSGGQCVWSCSQGTQPGDMDECVCQDGLTETGTDGLGRKICTLVCPVCDQCPSGMIGTNEVDSNGCHTCGCVDEPAQTNPIIKQREVKRIFKQIRAALEKTSNQIKKATDRLKRKFQSGSMYDGDAMNKVEWLNDRSSQGDWDSWISGAMTRIASFKDSYRDDGSPRGNLNGQDAMDESSIRMLVRIDSQKHLKNLKAELNRLMDRIYEGNEFVDPLKTKIDDLHDSTRGRSPASTWLVDAAALYKSLQQEYNSNGSPKN